MREEIKFTPIHRLRLFVKWAQQKGFCTSESNFEMQCGLSNKYLSNNANTGKGNISTEMLGRVIRKFPQLNLAWICTGEGGMTIEKNSLNTDYKKAYELATKQIEVLNNIIKKQQV